MRKCVILLLYAAIFNSTQGFTQEKDIPYGFGFNDPENYTEHVNLHSGAGTVSFVEEFGPKDFKTKHQFFRVGIIPPKSSIGEYRLTNSDELFVIMNGLVNVTVNSQTSRITGGSMVPARIGESIGIYNPTDENVTFAWLATSQEKGKYNPVDLGNNLTQNPIVEPCPFTWIPLDYGNFRMTISSAHQGAGPIYDAFGRINRDYFQTDWGAYYLVLPPGTSIGYHKHDIHEELYVVVYGNGRGTVDDVTRNMKPGDTTLCPLGSAHGIYNSGTEDLGVIVTLHSSLPSGEWDAKDLGDDLSKR
ncbi:cupin domain-containing protein [Candidatus Latescibacterota bacterium]